MGNSQANSQLELCCRLGSLDGILEALEEGADINCNGSAPLFTAVMANDRTIVTALIEKGADTSAFEINLTDQDEAVEALMALAPAQPAPDEGDPVDAKLVRAFDRMIRNKGLSAPIQKGRTAEYPAFADGLKWIAAEECHACVTELLEMVEQGPGPNGDDDGLSQFLADHAPRVDELSARYTAADELPGELLKDYLKEKKNRD